LPRRLATGERLTRTAPAGFLHVVAGVLRDRRGRVLLAERPAGKHLAGGWEFPGGKLHPGERRLAGLRRELEEELGVGGVAAHPLLRIAHRYPDRQVLLDVWAVTRYRGEPEGRDGQALRWCAVSALAAAGVLPADRPVVTALRLPPRLTATRTACYRIDRWPGPGGARLRGALCADARAARRAAAGGADFLVLDTRLAPRTLRALCDAVGIPVYARGLALARAQALGASGVNAISRAGG
jgi:mutator protein MutT